MARPHGTSYKVPYPLDTKITAKQQRFIDNIVKGYNYTEACTKAGYNGSPKYIRSTGSTLYKNLKLFIDERMVKVNEQIDKSTIFTVKEIQEKWSQMICDMNLKPELRVKVSELLVKSQGGFIERKEVKQVTTEWFIDEEDKV